VALLANIATAVDILSRYLCHHFRRAEILARTVAATLDFELALGEALRPNQNLPGDADQVLGFDAGDWLLCRGELAVNGFMATGKINGADGDGFPMVVDANVMNRGEERFNIFCSECHGRVGDGNGMIPSRGFRRPPSFHTELLRSAKTGHFFDVMTNGFGSMPSYAAQVPVEDRWAIIAYIRALQLSQNGTINDLPPDMRAKLAGGAQ
jgi:mono/diheme cytochrome c family protein